MGDAEEPTRSRTPKLPADLAMVVGALCIAATALIHLHLRSHGYGAIPTIGTLFLLQAIAGFALAVVVAAWHRWFVATAGALFLLATMGGLVYSVEFGLFGFSDSFAAPYAGMSLLIEGAGALVLGVAAVFLFLRDRRARRGVQATPGAATAGAGAAAS